MTSAFSIGGRQIGAGHPVYIIAELSANHRQQEDLAIELVHAASEAGADAIKLQTYTPDTITIASDTESFRAGADRSGKGRRCTTSTRTRTRRGSGSRASRRSPSRSGWIASPARSIRPPWTS